MVAKQEGVDGRGKHEGQVRPEFATRRTALTAALAELLKADSARTRWFAGRALFWVEMEEKSIATTWTPKDLFSRDLGIAFAAPWYSGYAVEIPLRAAGPLLARLRAPASAPQRVDISRIVGIRPLHEAVAGDHLTSAWRAARPDEQGYRRFVASLAPFVDRDARAALVGDLQASGLALSVSRTGANLLLSSAPPAGDQVPAVAIGGTAVVPAPQAGDVFDRLREAFMRGEYPRPIVAVRNEQDLADFVASGRIVRWDPIAAPEAIAPGAGPEPDPDPDHPLDASFPVVGLVDGGVTARRYQHDIAWRAPSFLEPGILDHKHANRVAGVIREAEHWNNQLDIPAFPCRIGDVAAVPQVGHGGAWDMAGFLRYLANTVAVHPDTKVWNISANLNTPCDAMRVSEFGHQLSIISRRHGVLFVISSGNRGGQADEKIAPPADAEAAITVSGRSHDGNGAVAGPCPVSRVGLGPEEMLKPEMSWFSHQRILGGDLEVASSYAAPLVSRVSAHTWVKLRQPTPDLVKALLINAADRADFDHRVGYGSPIRPAEPWLTGDNAVIFCWQQTMLTKKAYYWSGIRLPPSLTVGGKFRGRARLVAILAPVTHMKGTNYASTRLEAALQYQDGRGRWERLTGSVDLNTDEGTARRDDAKWQPLRVYERRSKQGITLGRGDLRVRARLYWRDQFMYPDGATDTWEVPVTFAVMLEASDADARVYDQFVTAMGTDVETAVIEAEIEQDVDG